MKFVKITPEFGIVIRKEALVAREVSLHAVLSIFGVRSAFDENDLLLSFGPHFGQEAAVALVNSLEGLGLVYVEDLFMFVTEVPDWCQLGASYADPASTPATG